MANYRFVAIERQYASGGKEIGQRVAEQLGIRSYGHEIMLRAADKTGISVGYLEQMEENSTSSVLFSLALSHDASLHGTAVLPPSDRIFSAESEVVREIAAEGAPCVFIGHAASCILADREDCLRVFIYADEEYRIRRAVEVYGIEKKSAPSVLRRFDKRRSNFYSANYTVGWDDREGYQILLNSGDLGIETCVDIIMAAFKLGK